MNPFVTTSIAKRYAEARPYHHDIVVDLVRKRLQLSGRVASALDVACGTGMSTRAMADIADKTVGTDVSPSMLVEAPGEPRLMYAAASAECLPFRPDSFELVTVSSALHWFDRCRFLAEVGAVTRPQGWLVIYENGFMGTMKENAAFADWRNDTYHTRYPAPPRHREPLTEDQARQAGFDFVSTEEYRNWVRFDPEALAKYLTTQSNVIAAVDEGRQTLAEVFEWLVGQVCPFFVAQSGTFEFGGRIRYLRKH
ncbi:MAG: class I SAM-dependent methyltransferase [bacterium]|nr:class I SAM-dependent methyltransferase [bacterium]